MLPRVPHRLPRGLKAVLISPAWHAKPLTGELTVCDTEVFLYCALHSVIWMIAGFDIFQRYLLLNSLVFKCHFCAALADVVWRMKSGDSLRSQTWSQLCDWRQKILWKHCEWDDSCGSMDMFSSIQSNCSLGHLAKWSVMCVCMPKAFNQELDMPQSTPTPLWGI